MNAIDPRTIFAELGRRLAPALRRSLVVVGSLAAACRFIERLRKRGIRTKDADLVVQPAGRVAQARHLMDALLDAKWTRSTMKGKECFPMDPEAPPDRCRAIRLMPPDSSAFYVELLGRPAPDQTEPVLWKAVDRSDGRYGMPCFRFMGLALEESDEALPGFRCAQPSMMALSHLLSHPQLGAQRVRDEAGRPRELRSAKDLGRALALWRLSTDDERASWAGQWKRGLRRCFPKTGRKVSGGIGMGLRALLADVQALREAQAVCARGLLEGQAFDLDQMIVWGEELLDGPVRANGGESLSS